MMRLMGGKGKMKAGMGNFETGSITLDSLEDMYFPKPRKITEYGRCDHTRYVIKTDEGYIKDIQVTFGDDNPYEVKADYTPDMSKAIRYTNEEDANKYATDVKGEVVIILVKEVIEVIK